MNKTCAVLICLGVLATVGLLIWVLVKQHDCCSKEHMNGHGNACGGDEMDEEKFSNPYPGGHTPVDGQMTDIVENAYPQMPTEIEEMAHVQLPKGGGAVKGFLEGLTQEQVRRMHEAELYPYHSPTPFPRPRPHELYQAHRLSSGNATPFQSSYIDPSTPIRNHPMW